MSENRIERETLIAASLERVWSLVADPGFWVADVPGPPGGAAEGESMVVKNAEHGDFPVRVEKVEPPTYVAYRWVSAFPGEELRDDNSTLVEFTLTPEGDEQTRLRVVESGHELCAWPDAEKERYAEEHQEGWVEFLDRLAVLVAKRRL